MLPYTLADVRAVPLNSARVVSAYAGCGGLDLGFRLAGFESVWANDVDPVAIQTFRGLLGPHAHAADIDAIGWPESGSAELVIGGPPCQGFSVAGRMDPSDPRSRHVDRFLDLVEHVAPQGFVLENVKALAVSERWLAVRERLWARAEALGFRAALYVLNAADFGTPQRRERMFFIGIRSGGLPASVTPAVERHLTVGEALDLLPGYGSVGNSTICSAGITPAKNPILRPSAFQGSLLFNGNGRPLDLASTAPTLPASMGGNATPIVDQHQIDTGEASWVAGYHRRLMSGANPVRRVPGQLRRITVEEAAQLQGFPLGTSFAGPISAKYRQIGNAVPPPLAFAVAQTVAEALGLELPPAAERIAA